MSLGDDRKRRGKVQLIQVSLARRRLCQWMVLPAAQLAVPALAWASLGNLASARVWPAQEYTRVVFEAPDAIAHRVQTFTDPHRVVLELDGVRLTPELAQLPTRVQADDPYIASIRFGSRGDTLRSCSS
jgi:hypothetical protein